MDNGTQEFVTLGLDAYEDVINHASAAKHMAMIAWDTAVFHQVWVSAFGPNEAVAIAAQTAFNDCIDILRCHPSYLGSK